MNNWFYAAAANAILGAALLFGPSVGIRFPAASCSSAYGLVVYAQNPAFLAKLCMLAVGVINAAVIHAGKCWCAAIWDGEIPAMLRTGAIISLIAWPSAIVAGAVEPFDTVNANTLS